MEPVTHMLTGACLSRTGLNRRAAYATLTMVVAAEFPDIDMLWSMRGPIEVFQHHRGITHTFLGLPFEAALVVAGVYGWHRWRVRRSRPPVDEIKPVAGDTAVALTRRSSTGRVVKSLTAAPVRWGVLYGLALLALLSHLLLDYMNNYGLRPFFPFNGRWYAASIVFIFDPLMFALLLGALTAPWLFGLVGAEVGARKQPFRARGWAIVALLGVLGWWGLREVEHGRAVQLAMAQSMAKPAKVIAAPGPVDPASPAPAEETPTYLTAQRALASPDPLSPFQWSAVTDFGAVYQLSEIDTRGGTVTPGDTTYPKPADSPAVRTAEASKLGRAYMDWSPMPFVEVLQADSELAAQTSREADGAEKVVTFRDPRFMGGWMEGSGRTPLVGMVFLDGAGKVVGESMDGRAEP
jgi:inner membrane protein